MPAEITTEYIIKRIGDKWDELHAYLGTLSEAQLTQKTDAGGWTVKDHLIHLSLWEDSLLALLAGQDRAAEMGVPQEAWKTGSDAVNAITQSRYKDMPLADVRKALADSHARVLAKIGAMSTAELLLPYKHYQPSTKRNAPVVQWVEGNTFGHYRSHLKWIKGIVESEN